MLTLPSGWMAKIGADRFQLTREGPNAQLIRYFEMGSTFVLHGQKTLVTATDSPETLSRVLVENFKTGSPGIRDIVVVEAIAASVCGQPGLRQVSTYATDRGLVYRHLVYAAVMANQVYYLDYDAPALYYFDRDVAAFEDMVRSCRLPPAR
jgi:hypothetical protein